MSSNSLACIALTAFIGLSSALGAGGAAAQSSEPSAPMPLNVYLGESRLPLDSAQQLMQQRLTPAEVASLRESNTAIQAESWGLRGDTLCLVHTTVARMPAELDMTPRASTVFGHAASKRKNGETLQAACGRAFSESLKHMSGVGAFEREPLARQSEWTSEPTKMEFAKDEKKEGLIAYWTGGTLNEKGENVIVKELGPRWHKVLDARKYSAYVFLLMGNTMEGENYCAVRYGITARAPLGRTPHLPGTMSIRFKTAPKDENCSSDVVMPALESLRNEYPSFFEVFSKSTEKGVSYMSQTEVEKKVAKFDAEAERVAAAEAKKAAAEAKKVEARQVASTTRSTNRVTCQNECYNGNCVRTFPDGRKERWQAPRKYDPFTQNWGWDTTTNACGI